MSNEPTSDDLDRLLEADQEAGERLAPRDDIRITLEVPVDATTLDRLTERAEREGEDVEDLVPTPFAPPRRSAGCDEPRGA